MIVTVTLNPSLDRTLEVAELVRGGVHRSGQVGIDAGGKGVNISRALTANGHPTRAVLPVGGGDGDVLADLLLRAGIDYVAVRIAGDVRSNVTVVEGDGTVTKINTPGPALSAPEVDALITKVLSVTDGAAWVACSGSLPPGAPIDIYARLVNALHAGGCAVAVDTTGEALEFALTAHPDVIKPNIDELAAAVGREVTTLAEVVAAAQELRDRGAQAVLVSLGADGAVLVDAGGATHGDAPVAVVRSTVGAGDAMLAGYLAAGGHGPDALAEALAWGAAAVQLPGSRMPGPVDIDRSLVRLLGQLPTTDTVPTGAEQ